MTTVTPDTVADEQALLAVWAGLDAGDDGAAVDVSRYTKVVCHIFGTFADTDAVGLEGAGYTTAGAAGAFAALETDVGFAGGGSAISTGEDATFVVEKLGGVKWIKPQGGGSTGVGTSAVNVVLMASRPAQ